MMYKKFRQWWGLKSRAVRLRLAGWIVKPLGCTTVAGDLVLQAAQKLAQLDSYIEKSSEIQHRKHAYARLVGSIREINQMLEGAVRIGDPAMSSEQLIQVYMQARWNSMSKNQQKRYQKMQAAQQISQTLKPKAS